MKKLSLLVALLLAGCSGQIGDHPKLGSIVTDDKGCSYLMVDTLGRWSDLRFVLTLSKETCQVGNK